jgi:hypothetical protein
MSPMETLIIMTPIVFWAWSIATRGRLGSRTTA